MDKLKIIVFLVMGFLLLPYVNAEEFGYGRTMEIPINFSLVPTVNNTIHWDGRLYDIFRWLEIDGGNANQNIDITPFNITAASFIGDGSQLTGLNFLALDGSNSPTAPISWGGQNLSDVENLFVDRNTRIANNVSIGGAVFITGDVEMDNRLVVGADFNQTNGCLNPGDGCFFGNVLTNASLIAFPKQYGTGLAVANFGDNAPENLNIVFTPGGTLNTSTGLFCDFNNMAFQNTSVGNIFTIVVSIQFGVRQIPLEVLAVVNSSCIDVSLGTFGDDSVPDITAFVYVTALAPIFLVIDNGNILATVGNNLESRFKINVPEATGASSFEINSIIGQSNTNIVNIFTDVNGTLDTRNFESVMTSSVPVNGSVQNNFMITGDLSNNNDGTYIGMELDLTSAGNNVTTTGLTISSLFDSLITSGQLVDISQAYYDNTTDVIDVTSDFDDPDTVTTLFQENDSTVYIGNTFNFTKISFSISAGGSQSILPQFFYCNSSGEWQSTSMADSTNGFQHSGSIEFTNPTNRGTCNKDLNNVAFANASSFLYIAIRRSEISITTPPVIRTVKIFRDSSKILIGNSDTINADKSFTFANEEFQPEGSIVHMVTSRDENGQPLINSWQVSVKNNSFSGFGNSFGLVPSYLGIENFSTNGLINMTALSDYPLLCLTFGVPCNFNADTRGNAIDLIPGGPLFFTFGDAEIWQSLKVHRGLSVSGPGIFDLGGEDFQVNNGTMHLAIPVTFEQGFNEGDSVTLVTETFSGTLGIFTNLQSGLGDWVSVISPTFCDDAQCAQATGAGSGLVEMQTNISTLDLNETGLSFIYSLVNLIGSGEFSVEVNNNVGSGDVIIFSDTTDNVLTDSEVIALPSSMDNQSLVTITVICNVASAAKPTRQCYFDTAKINGTAITTSTINVSSFNSVIAFGAGDLAPDGFPERGIIYNASSDLTIIRGNLNVTGCIMFNGGVLGTCV